MQAAPRRCQLLQEKSRTVVVTARSSRTTKNSSGRRLFSERTCCARSGVWSISELKVARMLEICQSPFFVERSAERCVAVMRSCRRSPAWARPRCLFWPACNRLAWLSVCGPPLPARDDSPPPDTSVCPPTAGRFIGEGLPLSLLSFGGVSQGLMWSDLSPRPFELW